MSIEKLSLTAIYSLLVICGVVAVSIRLPNSSLLANKNLLP